MAAAERNAYRYSRFTPTNHAPLIVFRHFASTLVANRPQEQTCRRTAKDSFFEAVYISPRNANTNWVPWVPGATEKPRTQRKEERALILRSAGPVLLDENSNGSEDESEPERDDNGFTTPLFTRKATPAGMALDTPLRWA